MRWVWRLVGVTVGAVLVAIPAINLVVAVPKSRLELLVWTLMFMLGAAIVVVCIPRAHPWAKVIITGLGVAGAAGGFLLAFAEAGQNIAPPTPTAAWTSTPTTSIQPESTATIEAPLPKSETPLRGTTASVRIPGELPSGSTLWLFVKSPDDGGVHFVANEIFPYQDQWEAETGQIGSEEPDEVGKLFTLELVLANPEATKEIRTRIETNNRLVVWEGWNGSLPQHTEILSTVAVERI